MFSHQAIVQVRQYQLMPQHHLMACMNFQSRPVGNISVPIALRVFEVYGPLHAAVQCGLPWSSRVLISITQNSKWRLSTDANRNSQWLTGHDYGLLEACQHEGQRCGCVRHGVCPMHYQEGVISLSVVMNELGKLDPLRRPHSRGVHIEGDRQFQICKGSQLWH